MALLAQSTFTIRRLAKDELNLVFSSDTVAIPSKNGVADLSTAEFEVKVTKGGRELFPVFDEEIGGRNLIRDSDWVINSGSKKINYSGLFLKEDNVEAILSFDYNVVNAIKTQSPFHRIGIEGDYRNGGRLAGWIYLEEGKSVSGRATFKVILKRDSFTYLNAYVQTGGDIVELGNFKLEKGNKPTDWTPAPEDILTNAILSEHNCTAVVDGSKIKLTSIEDGKDVGYVDVTVSYGEGNNVTRRFTWARAETGVSITNVDVEYAVNNNTSTAPTTGWSTLPPISLSSGQQLWTRTVTSYSTGSPTYSVPANITPQVGQGVESIIEEFAISTSKTTQPSTGWDTTPPTWVNGSYIWARTKITYKNPAQVVYTGYAVSSEWEAINELEIGGRNYWAISKNPWHAYLSYQGDGVFTNAVPYSQFAIFRMDRLEVPVGETYTLSFEINVSDDAIQFQDNVISVNSVIRTTHNRPTLVKDKWIKVYATFNYTVENTMLVHIYFRDIPAKDTFQIRNIKLEKGSKATDWTPAPEDVQAKIDSKVATSTYTSKMTQLDTAITARVTQTDFNALGQRVGAAEGTLTTQAGLIAAKASTSSVTALGTRVTTAEGTINAHTGQINSKVAKTDYDANNTAIQNQFSNINQRADGIELSVTNVNNKVDDIEIGGRNLIIPSSYVNFGTNQVSKDGYSLSIERLGSNKVYFYMVEVEPDTEYTITFKTDNIDNAPTRVYLYSKFPSSSTDGRISWVGGVNSGYTLTTPSNIRYLGVGVNPVNIESELPVKFYDWQLEKGNKATDWSPAPEDVQAEIDKRVTTTVYDAKMTLLDDAISQRVTQGTYDTNNNLINGKFASINTRADGIESSVGTVNNKIDNLEIGGRNLIIRSSEEIGTWIDTTGAVKSSANHSTTDYIKVEPSKTYSFSKIPSVLVTEGIGGYWRYSWYDEDKVYISRTAQTSLHNLQWKIPNNAHYVRLSYPVDSQPKFEKGNKVTDFTLAPEDVQSKIDSLGLVNRNYAYIRGTRICISNDFPRNSKQYFSLSLWGNFEAFANVDPFGEILFSGDGDSPFLGYTYTRKSVNHVIYEGGYVDLSREEDENLALSLYGMASEGLITKVKIDIGPKATDWTQAPEATQYDYESKIKQAADSISLAVYNKTLDALTPATELKLTSDSIKLVVANDIADAKSQAISAASTDATNKVAGLKTGLSGTGIDITAKTLTLFSGAKDGNAGGQVIIAGSNFSVDAEGKIKAVDGEFSGKITATEGTIGSMKLQSNMLVSSSEKLIIDGTSSTITLKDASSDDVKILIKQNNLPTSPATFFGSTTKSASFTAIKNTITINGNTLSSNTITVGANESYTFNIPSVTLTAYVSVPGIVYEVPKMSASATAELYLTDGSLEIYIGSALAMAPISSFDDVIVLPATTRTITTPGTWRLRLRYKLRRGGYNWDEISGYAKLESSSSTYSAVPIVNRSEFGANGLIVATSANEYAFMVGSTFEVRRQNHMLRVTSSDIQVSKNAGSKWSSLHSGVLGVVHFTIGSGIIYQWTKDGSTISLSNITSNPFRINHSIGHTNYFAIPSVSGKYAYLQPQSRLSTYCTFTKSEVDSGHLLTVLLVGNG